jgi:hypothetical protein
MRGDGAARGLKTQQATVVYRPQDAGLVAGWDLETQLANALDTASLV